MSSIRLTFKLLQAWMGRVQIPASGIFITRLDILELYALISALNERSNHKFIPWLYFLINLNLFRTIFIQKLYFMWTFRPPGDLSGNYTNPIRSLIKFMIFCQIEITIFRGNLQLLKFYWEKIIKVTSYNKNSLFGKAYHLTLSLSGTKALKCV